MRYLGVDPGSKRTGLAVSDPEGRMAFPHAVLSHGSPGEQLELVLGAVRETEAQVVVVGRPLTLSGEAGPAARKTGRLASRLARRAVRVVLWDERRTTKEAVSSCREMGLEEREWRGVVDSMAAALILQSYLDHINTDSTNFCSNPVR